jgi:deoxyxylulose-5-phosphate synthase
MSLGNIRQKFDAFGWKTLETNDNIMDEIVTTFKEAKSLTGQGQPVAILMHTIMGKGVDFMENDHGWHGTTPNDKQLKKALAQLPETIGDYKEEYSHTFLGFQFKRLQCRFPGRQPGGYQNHDQDGSSDKQKISRNQFHWIVIY